MFCMCMDIRDVRPGTSVRVIAGINRNWLKQMTFFAGAKRARPFFPELHCFVIATIIRVHRDRKNISKSSAHPAE
jgi:hypothetical protein